MLKEKGQIVQRTIQVFGELNYSLTVLIFSYALHNMNMLRPLREVTPQRVVQCIGLRLSKDLNVVMVT